MQATIDQEKRRVYRQKILENLSVIVTTIDDLDRTAADAKRHLHLHDRFFFQHGTNLQTDESYGTQDELVDLYLDTCQMINRLERARSLMGTACALMHYYDYSSNPVFDEYARVEARNL
ncbi:MAG: hypothetical protein WCX63_00830 [Methanoregula sp.]